MALKIIALVLPLGLDTFAVAAALGALGAPGISHRRLALTFALFEGGMPLAGLAAGAPLGHALGEAAEFVAAGVLLVAGGLALRGDDDDERLRHAAAGGGRGALALGVAVSLDELAIGVTLGLLRVPVAIVVGLIALQAAVMTWAGLAIGARLGEAMRERAERLAGVVLILLAAGLLIGRIG